LRSRLVLAPGFRYRPGFPLWLPVQQRLYSRFYDLFIFYLCRGTLAARKGRTFVRVRPEPGGAHSKRLLRLSPSPYLPCPLSRSSPGRWCLTARKPPEVSNYREGSGNRFYAPRPPASKGRSDSPGHWNRTHLAGPARISTTHPRRLDGGPSLDGFIVNWYPTDHPTRLRPLPILGRFSFSLWASALRETDS